MNEILTMQKDGAQSNINDNKIPPLDENIANKTDKTVILRGFALQIIAVDAGKIRRAKSNSDPTICTDITVEIESKTRNIVL